MLAVLTEKSMVTCAHQGTVNTSGSDKLRVKGNKVLLKIGIEGKDITGCLTKDTDPNGVPTTRQCQKVSGIPRVLPTDPPSPEIPAVTAGFATKLKVNNEPAMLETLVGLSNGWTTPPPKAQDLAKPQANQTILFSK